uniref:Tctex1 domain-containing protein 2 n=1 Tax=Haptolina ericina TaxID=156174 RepID=A0A7S3ASZ1_9EUKA|mmetsp:Transcript_31167/g.70433  ORF Transcript_31167/g.70433 Transcript_31167/m.70433 type:complete len:125 (+) Transcript_31167:28-402(+)|eukprot:CAMPEP_0181198040 /NCGR_PEP_ID=MMETSP1096-20121128/16387_1 /TAXON_ID=156174 ORGANISM="Chrysochromulina ericina, Strain CCMP281" /NCGR_SAMPLE_ID=MMETSP1096 /ASSEMBLY_ACC=CAM_ASM_000453 /LENGTH=124 /DNA_ID=CAMNT_0023288041 /DNA_START=33 /DNA_END=407 /DNA_ORIENTATION=+
MPDAETGELFNIRPSFREKFRPSAVKPLISAVLAEKLADKTYNPELTAQWTREIADEIKNKLKSELELPRYKYVVQVLIGEQRGEGVRMGCRCFWDADTDNYAEDTYRNDSLFCVAAAFGAFLY